MSRVTPSGSLTDLATALAADLGAAPARRRRRANLGLQLPEIPFVSEFMSGGDENTSRHKEGADRQRPPRPYGLASGASWEPREPTRSFAGASLTFRALETLEEAPWLQDIAVAASKVVHHFVTQTDSPLPADVPDETGAWKFAALGDYGAGTPHLTQVAKNIAAGHPDLIITAGDNVYPDGRWIDYARNWEPAMGPLARSTKFMPALGNHDQYRDDLRPYFAHFPQLQGNAFYTFIDHDAQFYALDGDEDLRVGSAQYRWLEQSLRSSHTKWKVVYLHYPMYGSSLQAFDEIRTAVQPLLEKYGVQLVIAGHEHNYLRSEPIGGVTHILTGGGGQRVYPFGVKQAPHLARRAAEYHHLEVSVGATRMVVRAIAEDGSRMDTVAIPVGAVAEARLGAAQLVPAPVSVRRTRRRR